jgi:hypothetical protein
MLSKVIDSFNRFLDGTPTGCPSCATPHLNDKCPGCNYVKA